MRGIVTFFDSPRGTEKIWIASVFLFLGGLMVEIRLLWRALRLAWFCTAEQAKRYLRVDFPRHMVTNRVELHCRFCSPALSPTFVSPLALPSFSPPLR